jgi:hypothetical protein
MSGEQWHSVDVELSDGQIQAVLPHLSRSRHRIAELLRTSRQAYTVAEAQELSDALDAYDELLYSLRVVRCA